MYTALSQRSVSDFQWATAAKLPFANSTELGNSALYVVGFLLRYTNDLIERVNGKIPYDNRDTQYQVQRDPGPGDERLSERSVERGR